MKNIQPSRVMFLAFLPWLGPAWLEYKFFFDRPPLHGTEGVWTARTLVAMGIICAVLCIPLSWRLLRSRSASPQIYVAVASLVLFLFWLIWFVWGLWWW